jgi:hypothetical protein
MTTVRICSDLAEAEVIKSVLEGSGVAAFVPDENTALWSNVIGGYRVEVDDVDVDRANEVLKQSDQVATEPPTGSS